MRVCEQFGMSHEGPGHGGQMPSSASPRTPQERMERRTPSFEGLEVDHIDIRPSGLVTRDRAKVRE